MGVAVKPVRTGWRPKGRSVTQARIERLRQRYQAERDPKVRASVEAQLRALDRTFEG